MSICVELCKYRKSSFCALSGNKEAWLMRERRKIRQADYANEVWLCTGTRYPQVWHKFSGAIYNLVENHPSQSGEMMYDHYFISLNLRQIYFGSVTVWKKTSLLDSDSEDNTWLKSYSSFYFGQLLINFCCIEEFCFYIWDTWKADIQHICTKENFI